MDENPGEIHIDETQIKQFLAENGITVTEGIKSIEMGVTVIRASGRKEEIGPVSAYYKNPFKKLIWFVKRRSIARKIREMNQRHEVENGNSPG